MLAALDPILLDLARLFGLCVAAVLVFWKLRVPPLVGFLLTGAVIGPNATGLVGHIELVEQLAEVGVVILLFSVGMELPLRQLARLRRTVLVGGGLQIGLTLLLGAGAALLAGLPLEPAIFLGLLLAASTRSRCCSAPACTTWYRRSSRPRSRSWCGCCACS
jgi:CPA2 family monovalent cation:H+ antiporter-2